MKIKNMPIYWAIHLFLNIIKWISYPLLMIIGFIYGSSAELLGWLDSMREDEE